MGMLIYNSTPSSKFMPGNYGLAAGDLVQAVVVGGGAGGAYGWSTTSHTGGAGYQSSFGSYVTASGASTTPATSQGIGMFNGGAGASTSSIVGGGGAGGFIPGVPIWGGNGETACGSLGANGTAGQGAGSTHTFPSNSYGGAPYGNAGSCAGGGGSAGGGGAGYGAGGGGYSKNTSNEYGSGGGSGYMKFGFITLSASDITNGIAITVGGGGGGATELANGGAGTSSGGGTGNTGGYAGNPGSSYVDMNHGSGGGGAGGCVIVFW